MLPAAVLTGLAFAIPAAAWGVTVTRSQQINKMFRFVIMPLYMFSGTFFAITQLPEWIRWLAYVLPLYHGVELCRTPRPRHRDARRLRRPRRLPARCSRSSGFVIARRNYRKVLHL